MDSGGSSDVGVAQLPGLIKEWMTAEDEIRTLGAAIKEKRKRVKVVRGMITTIMKGGKIGKLNISSGAVMMRERSTKAALSKKYLVPTLTDFFKGDAAKAAECYAFIESHRPIKRSEDIALEPTV
ncbi:hypothetical protein EBX31_00290 [bacterium]|nr:hypothetical protein [bacterium]